MLYIGLPSHNEATTVGVLLWRLRTVLAEVSREYEVVVYDDASTDGTADVLAPYARVLPLTLLRGERRVGTGGAVDAIVRHVVRTTRYPRRDGLLLMQADFTDAPGLVPEFLRRFEGGADLVIGERRSAGDAPTAVRRLLSASRWVLRPFVGITDVRDLTTSFRLARVAVLRDLLRATHDAPVCAGDGWSAQAELLLHAAPHARRIETIPVTPSFAVRTRESRRRAWPDTVALARWAWQHRGLRIAAKVVVRDGEPPSEPSEVAEALEEDRLARTERPEPRRESAEPRRRERSGRGESEGGTRERSGSRENGTRERSGSRESGARERSGSRESGARERSGRDERRSRERGGRDERDERDALETDGREGRDGERRAKRKAPGEGRPSGGAPRVREAAAAGEPAAAAPGAPPGAEVPGEDTPDGRRARRRRRGRRGRSVEGGASPDREAADGLAADGLAADAPASDTPTPVEPSGADAPARTGAASRERGDAPAADRGDTEAGEPDGTETARPRRRARRGRRRTGEAGERIGPATTGDDAPPTGEPADAAPSGAASSFAEDASPEGAGRRRSRRGRRGGRRRSGDPGNAGDRPGADNGPGANDAPGGRDTGDAD